MEAVYSYVEYIVPTIIILFQCDAFYSIKTSVKNEVISTNVRTLKIQIFFKNVHNMVHKLK